MAEYKRYDADIDFALSFGEERQSGGTSFHKEELLEPLFLGFQSMAPDDAELQIFVTDPLLSEVEAFKSHEWGLLKNASPNVFHHLAHGAVQLPGIDSLPPELSDGIPHKQSRDVAQLLDQIISLRAETGCNVLIGTTLFLFPTGHANYLAFGRGYAGAHGSDYERYDQDQHGIRSPFHRVDRTLGVLWNTSEGTSESWFLESMKHTYVADPDEMPATQLLRSLQDDDRRRILLGNFHLQSLDSHRRHHSTMPRINMDTKPGHWPREFKGWFPDSRTLETFDPREHRIAAGPWHAAPAVRQSGWKHERVYWDQFAKELGAISSPDEFRQRANGALILTLGDVPLPEFHTLTATRLELLETSIHFIHVTSGRNVVLGNKVYPCPQRFSQLYDDLEPAREWSPATSAAVPDSLSPQPTTFDERDFSEPAAWGQNEPADTPRPTAAVDSSHERRDEASTEGDSDTVVYLRDRIRRMGKR